MVRMYRIDCCKTYQIDLGIYGLKGKYCLAECAASLNTIVVKAFQFDIGFYCQEGDHNIPRCIASYNVFQK